MHRALLGALAVAVGMALIACAAPAPPDPRATGPYLERSTSRPFTRWMPNGEAVDLWMVI
jgi:hypothetical protein